MTRISVNSCIAFTTQLTLTEIELRALDALVGYGFEPFLDTFYKNMGRAYLEPHAKGLKSLFETIGKIRSEIGAIDRARAILADGKTPTAAALREATMAGSEGRA